MKILIAILLSSVFFYHFALPAFADTLPPTPVPNITQTPDTSPPPGTTLGHFLNGFDWISDGIIFHTPDIFTNPITLQDGTQLNGVSQFRNIFWDIAIPVFAIILAAVALSHINSDNMYQLKNFGKRFVVVAVLFIISASLLEYSIEFINLLDQQIMNQGTNTIVPMMVSYVNSPDFQSVVSFNWNPLSFFNPNTLLQVLLLIIAFGFFLIGFLYIIFQAVARFIALLILSVLLPIAIPFALSERTQNITNTYFKMWFTFLIGQPAFILGYCLSSVILASLLRAHGGSIGTLFLFSGSLLFLGGINVFVGRIFGDGWSLVATDLSAGITNSKIHTFVNKNVSEVKKGMITGQETGIRSSIGAAIGRKMGFLTMSESEDEKKKSSNSFQSQPAKKKTPRKSVAI